MENEKDLNIEDNSDNEAENKNETKDFLSFFHKNTKAERRVFVTEERSQSESTEVSLEKPLNERSESRRENGSLIQENGSVEQSQSESTKVSPEKPESEQDEPQSKSPKKKTSPLTKIAIILLAAVFIFSAYKLASILIERKRERDAYKTIQNEAVSTVSDLDIEESMRFLAVDEAALKEINDDYIGWIQIPASDLSYPIVESSDNADYIHLSFEKEYSSHGTIFSDMRNSADFSDFQTILYGHNMKDGTMFNNVKLYRDEEYYNAHREIRIYRGEKVYIYKVFSFYETVDTGEEYSYSFNGNKGGLIDLLQRRSYYKSDTDVGEDDHIITLSTCSRVDSEYRWVLSAVLIEE